MILFQIGVYIIIINKIEIEVTGEIFFVEFEIIDFLYKFGKFKYFVVVSNVIFNGGM